MSQLTQPQIDFFVTCTDVPTREQFLQQHPGIINLHNARGQTALIYAVQYRQVKDVAWLLEHRANINKPCSQGLTPLMWAAAHGIDEMVQMLLANGADISLEDPRGLTAAQWANRNNNPDLAVMIHDWQRDAAHKISQREINDFIYAGRDGNMGELVSFLEKYPGAIDRHGAGDWTALMFACRTGQLEAVRLLLDYGADPQDIDDAKRTPMMFAAAHGHDREIALLLQYGADVNARDASGWSPLTRAVDEGHVATTQLLLKNGADMNVRDKNNWTPLMHAMEKEYGGIAALLITHGADINACSKHIERTALMMAAAKGNAALVEQLLNAGADFKMTDHAGDTALMIARQGGYEGAIRLLEDAPEKERQRLAREEQQRQDQIAQKTMQRIGQLKSRRPPRPKL